MSDGDTRPDGHPYDAPHLARNPANYAALTPLGFLERAAAIYPDKLAVIEPAGEGRGDGVSRIVSSMSAAAALPTRCAGAASGRATRSSVLAPNVPALLEAHYAVPMAGAVLNALNYRLDARSIAFILGAWRGEAADRRPRVRRADGRRRCANTAATCRSSRSPAADGGQLARRGRIRGFPRRGRSRWPNGRRPRTNGARSR